MERRMEGQRIRRTAYRTNGNTAYQLSPSYREAFSRGLRLVVRRKGAALWTMNLSYLIFMSLAVLCMGVLLTWYIGLQSSVIAAKREISSLEYELNRYQETNDEAWHRANARVDLEEIKNIAIGQYGMTYAGEGQIVPYSDEGAGDYVNQKAEIPALK